MIELHDEVQISDDCRRNFQLSSAGWWIERTYITDIQPCFITVYTFTRM